MRSVAWYVLLGVFFVLLLVVTVLAFASFGYHPDSGAGVYSAVVFFVLLLAVLVSPTLSGNAINGDRDAATLAPVQVTLATTGEILIAKFLAAWITGLAFVAVVGAVPARARRSPAGSRRAMVVVSLVVLIVEIGVIAAIGVGPQRHPRQPLFSVAATYLVVAALVVGTLIAFGLGRRRRSAREVVEHRTARSSRSSEDGTAVCGEWQTSTYETPRFDTVWWVLAANPFVILADATPTTFDRGRLPARPVRAVQARDPQRAGRRPRPTSGYDDCAVDQGQTYPTPRETIDVDDAELVRGARPAARARRRAARGGHGRAPARPRAACRRARASPERRTGSSRVHGLASSARSARGSGPSARREAVHSASGLSDLSLAVNPHGGGGPGA